MLVPPRPRHHLAHAIREIRVLAGIDDPSARAFGGTDEPAGLSRTLVAVPSRALKGPRGSSQPAESYVIDPIESDHAAGTPLPPRSLAIGITSAGGGEGKTTLAIALASSLCADFDAQVTLVDADFETHSIGRDYGLEGREGLAEVLAGEHTVPAVMNHFVRAPLSVVTAGVGIEDAGRLAHSERLGPAIRELKAKSRFVVLDLPSTLGGLSAPALAQHCDGVILVARARHTSQRDLRRTLRLLKGANVLGVVLNRTDSKIPGWLDRMLDLPA